ncbi:MAG: aminoglycoside 6-adenylyltransferase [Vallitaleaceae bacterium]|jgi:aminoglycoside 6-adenylyltransferase|nr:aminoglycoside 6-adenylyltransferase [Vallitaleaceae bacterium]
MRTEKEMMDLIMGTAMNDQRIRGVIMNGSRTNPNVKVDFFQDFDIVYIVRDLPSFTDDHSWIDVFGEIMILQMPEEITLIPPDADGRFIYLMQFMDGNRIDLSLVPVQMVDTLIESDSLSVLLLDMDNLFKPFPPASDSDYIEKTPSAKAFSDCCNEFWWVSTYVAKGIWREELPYVKANLDVHVRDMFMLMMTWYIGVTTDFSVASGKDGKYFKQYLSPEMWEKFTKTYADSDYKDIWQSLFIMCEMFENTAIEVARRLGYDYPYEEARRVYTHLKHIENLPRDATEMY